MVKLTSRSPLAGLTVGNMSPALAEELSIETGNDGVVVSEIEEGSTAANVGFQRGDIIKALNGEQMTTSREVEAILRDRRRAWEVTIIRNGQTITSVFPG
jgi:S1-C subfamily serine protease